MSNNSFYGICENKSLLEIKHDNIPGTVSIDHGGTGATTASEAVSNLKSALVNLIYPIGSYYWSSASTSPSTLFGGIWTQVKDKFVLAAGSTYNVGNMGGEASHTLTVSEIPSHRHNVYMYYTGVGSGANQNSWGFSGTSAGVSSDYIGGGGSHNNMPPYIVAYCWRRTA